MSDPSPTGAVPPATPMVSPTFRGDGWNLSPAEQARVAATLAIIVSLFSGRTSASPGIICNYGRSFTKRGSKSLA